MNSVMASMMPTAARSVVGTHCSPAFGQPRAPQPLLQTAKDRARGEEALRAAAQDRRIARLEAERPCVRGDVRARFVNHADHPERHAHARDVQPIRALPARQLRADRVVEPGDRLEPGGHRLDAHRIQRQAIEQRCPQAALLRRRHVLGVGGQEFALSGAQAVRSGAERPIFQRARRDRQDVRRRPGALSQSSRISAARSWSAARSRSPARSWRNAVAMADQLPPDAVPSLRRSRGVGQGPRRCEGLLAAAAGHGHEAAAEVPKTAVLPDHQCRLRHGARDRARG